METINQVNAEILKIMGNIRSNYPELAKYLQEMPTSFSPDASNEITLNQLIEYKNSLEELLSNYVAEEVNTKSKYQREKNQ